MARKEPFKFDIDDRVEKRRGYRWPGVIVMRGHTIAGKARYVVECREPAVRGALHIFSAKDLRRRGAVLRLVSKNQD